VLLIFRFRWLADHLPLAGLMRRGGC
jgi:hypothetical protein